MTGLAADQKEGPDPLVPWWAGLVLGTLRAFLCPLFPHTSRIQQAVLPRCLLIPSGCADGCEVCWCHSDRRDSRGPRVHGAGAAPGRTKGQFWGWLTHGSSLHLGLQAAKVLEHIPCSKEAGLNLHGSKPTAHPGNSGPASVPYGNMCPKVDFLLCQTIITLC